MPRKPLLEKFLTFFGDVKWFGWKRPLWLLYHPEGYRVRGEDVRQVIDTVQPGDILVRGYLDYLDGRFIPGYFSHVGLYVGEVTEADREYVRVQARGLKGEGAEPVFRTGRQMVIHALAEGVRIEDVIDFCRCDYMAVLRFPAVLRATPGVKPPVLERTSYSPEELRIHERLAAGETVPFGDAFPSVKAAALGKLGARYDFDFDFRRFDRLSCSELVYFATKSLAWFHGVRARDTRVLGFLRRSLIEPDAFVSAPLELVSQSPSVDERALAALRPMPPAAGEAGRRTARTG